MNILGRTQYIKLYKHSLQPFYKNLFQYLWQELFLVETDVKLKGLQTPRMSKTMRKSSKQKQKFYIKFLKSKNPEDELIYKNYKNFSKNNRKNPSKIIIRTF